MATPTAPLTTAAEKQLHLILRDVCGVRTMDVIETLKPFLTTYAAQVRREGAKPSEWLPITSAPRDGRFILGWCRQWADQVIALRYLTGLDCWNTSFQPTHWQPLPLPPPQKDPQS